MKFAKMTVLINQKAIGKVLYVRLIQLRRIPSSGILHCVSFVRTGVSEEHISSVIRVTRIGRLEQH
jgi:hypothetical protein